MMKKYAKYMPMSGFPAKRGSALQISTSVLKDKETVRLFVEMAPQIKDKPPSGSTESPFDWNQKIFMALKEEEVGRFLACLRGRVGEMNLIHKFPIDAPKEEQKTSKLLVKQGEYNDTINWLVNLKQKIGLNDEVGYSVYLQPEEAEILIVLLEDCIRKMYRL